MSGDEDASPRCLVVAKACVTLRTETGRTVRASCSPDTFYHSVPPRMNVNMSVASRGEISRLAPPVWSASCTLT